MYRTDGGIFNLRRLNARFKIKELLACDLLYADDCALAAHSLEDAQRINNCFTEAAARFGLTISIKKTELLKQTRPGAQPPPGDVLINDIPLTSVDNFCYLVSIVSSHVSLDSEVTHRIAKASTAFGLLRRRLWSERGVSLSTKIKAYQAIVISTLLLSSRLKTDLFSRSFPP